MLEILKWIGYTLIALVVLCMVIGGVILVATILTFGGFFFAAVFVIAMLTILVKEGFDHLRNKPAD